MDKITTINGILMATQNDFNEHVENAAVHVTEKERTEWNAKADASALASHEENAAIHVSREENDTRYGLLNAENTWTHGRGTLEGGEGDCICRIRRQFFPHL
ncbi:MAG: hypothetical protein LUE13_06565 [Akkermansiaceae bacterium]|nr:hypothetical protein [Akkermansiaceae bacterium]